MSHKEMTRVQRNCMSYSIITDLPKKKRTHSFIVLSVSQKIRRIFLGKNGNGSVEIFLFSLSRSLFVCVYCSLSFCNLVLDELMQFCPHHPQVFSFQVTFQALSLQAGPGFLPAFSSPVLGHHR